VQVSLDDIAAVDDVDQCIIYYNHAVILYYLKQYKAAFAVLDKVMQFIEPMGMNSSLYVNVRTANRSLATGMFKTSLIGQLCVVAFSLCGTKRLSEI